MCHGCDCSTWFDLSKVGLSGEGCIRDAAFLSSIRVPCTQNVVTPQFYTKTLTARKPLPGSTYSRIELGSRTHEGRVHDVFLKSPLIPGKSLLYEACIQQIVRDSLDRGGFAKGAPRVHDVFRLLDGSVCFSMDLVENARPLSALLQDASDLTPLILDVLLNLTAMLAHLETDIGMNHRDLKPSNLLVEIHEPRTRLLTVHGTGHRILSSYTITLIDFGFSCIGDSTTQRADLAIGDVYGVADPCPKRGRDLFMFLAFLYMECGTRIQPDLRTLFGKWLQNGKTGLLAKLDTYGHEFDQWIYFITGNEQVAAFDCYPLRVFSDLVKLGKL
jgi:serine/threonine protein kinase